MANTEFYLKKGDTSPSITVICKDENGDVVPLTAATGATFSMIDPGTDTPKIDKAAAVIEDAAAGKVRYDWASGDVDTPGEYNGEVEVAWSAGGTTTFPNFRYIKIEILDDIPAT